MPSSSTESKAQAWRAALLIACAAFLALGSASSNALYAQEPAVAAPKDEVVEEQGPSLPWLRSVSEAKAKAKAEGKDLFINFTGSDWCGWCTRLDQEVFSHVVFQEAAQKEFVFLYLDFPMSDEAKAKVVEPEVVEAIRESLGVKGFPTIVLADADGNPYGRTGYLPDGPEGYQTHIAELRTNGAKIKALIATTDPALERKHLEEAFPVLMSQELLGFSGYGKYLEAAEKIQALSGRVATFKANLELEKIMSSPDEPDWTTVFAFLQKNKEILSGPMYLNACWGTAIQFGNKKEYDNALTLLEQIRLDPLVVASEQMASALKEQITVFQNAKAGGGDHEGHDHGPGGHEGHDHP